MSISFAVIQFDQRIEIYKSSKFILIVAVMQKFKGFFVQIITNNFIYIKLPMRNNLRVKTDIKSTNLLQECEEPQLQDCEKELLKHLHKDSLFQNLLIRVLHRLALKPSDLLPLSRQEVARMSKKQTKQLFKEDIDYYLDNKCSKLEARRIGLLSEVARQYEQTEKIHSLASKFASHLHSDIQVTKRRPANRYADVDDSEKLIRNEEKRMKVLKKLRIQEISQRDLKNKALDNITRKFSAAESRKSSYRAYVESLRSSPIMSPEQHRKKMDDLHESSVKKSQELKQHLISKLERATKSRAERKQLNQTVLHQKNQQTSQRIKTIKQTSSLVEQQLTKMLDKEIEHDVEVHLKNKMQISEKKIDKLHKRRQREQKKIESIKIQLRKRQEQEQEKQMNLINQKEEKAEHNKQQIKERMEQMVRQKQKARDMRIGDIYRRKSLADLDGEKRRNVLLRYRLETEAMVSQRKHSMEVQKRRKHILEQIKIEISTMNVKRHHKMQEIKQQQTKQQLKLVDKRHQQFQQKKDHMFENREKLKMIFQRRKHNLDMYFDLKSRNPKRLSVNFNKSFLTNPMSRSVDVEQNQKTRKFTNMSIDI